VTLTRGDLVQKVDAAGTIVGTPLPVPIAAQSGGIVTWLPPIQSSVSRGQPLFRLDNVPVILLYGSTPAWRDFGPGMSDGPDLAELESNLLALGFGESFGLKADGVYTNADAEAIDAFGASDGLGVSSGTLPFGSVLFEPTPVTVLGYASGLGTSVSGGANILEADGTAAQVVAEVDASEAAAIVEGTPATITTVSSASALGATVSAVSASPPTNLAAGASGSTEGEVYVTLSLTNPPSELPAQGATVAVQFRTAVLNNVFTVPVTALVALVGGGYALQIDEGHGRSRLVGVQVGLIDDVDDVAQVTGSDLREGLAVEVPAG
jgi:peptidoglycan hydrolase-like protein with peptidoglycan-binding domain